MQLSRPELRSGTPNSNMRRRSTGASALMLCAAWLAGFFPGSPVLAQAMTVIGGNQKAENCYRQAQFADELITRFSLEDCHYALNYVSLKRRDRAATLTNRGIVYLALGQPAEALADFEAAMAIDPDKGEIYVNRGNAWFMSGEVNRAIEDYQAAADLGIEQQHIVFLNLGIAYERQGAYGEAEAAYEEALALSPQWSVASDNLMNLREKMAAEANP